MNKSKLQVLYSVAILIIVPTLLVFNTILLATNVRKDYDKELQSRAELANSVLAQSIRDEVVEGDSQKMVNTLDELKNSQNELRNIAVIKNDGGEYIALASTSDGYEISNSDKLQYDIAYSRKWPVAKNVAAFTDGGASTRAWNVATPIISVSGDVVGIVSSDLLTTDVDEKFDATLKRSVYIMIVSAIAVLILLFNHFRLIGYASLLNKQKELNQTMSDFLSVATHELKAPMSIIKGYIANVMDGDFGEVSEPVKEQLQVASSQTDRLNGLVQDLLNVSRIEQGKLTFDIKPVNATNIINTIVKNYTDMASEKGISIEYETSSGVWLQADEGRVQEIFTNLIDNAVKYSLKGSVVIRHKNDGKNIITSVRDSGIGMSAEERAHLFQRFYRVKNDDTKDISGTGLGLWIIKQYIEKMGGNIQVDSLVGSGTEFRVSLPAGMPPQQPDVLSDNKQANPNNIKH